MISRIVLWKHLNSFLMNTYYIHDSMQIVNITCVNLLSFTAIRLQKWSDNQGTLVFHLFYWNLKHMRPHSIWASTTNCVGLKMSGWTLIYRVAISLLHTQFLKNAKVLVGTWLRHSVANTIYIWVHRTHWKQK